MLRESGRPQWVNGTGSGIRIEYRAGATTLGFGLIEGLVVQVDFDK